MPKKRLTLGKIIAAQRLKSGISQETLAHLAGIHRTYVSQLERDLKSPTVTVLAKIAEALGTRPSRLLQLLETPTDELSSSKSI